MRHFAILQPYRREAFPPLSTRAELEVELDRLDAWTTRLVADADAGEHVTWFALEIDLLMPRVAREDRAWFRARWTAILDGHAVPHDDGTRIEAAIVERLRRDIDALLDACGKAEPPHGPLDLFLHAYEHLMARCPEQARGQVQSELLDVARLAGLTRERRRRIDLRPPSGPALH